MKQNLSTQDEKVYRILAVEDEKKSLILLLSHLKNIDLNLQCFVAEDGIEAINMFNDVSPDLVILDILLPEMDGFQFAEAINKHSNLQHTPILICSAVAEVGNVRRTLSMGVMDYILKPYKFEQLNEKIFKILPVMQKQHKIYHHKIYQMGEIFICKIVGDGQMDVMTLIKNKIIERVEQTAIQNPKFLMDFQYIDDKTITTESLSRLFDFIWEIEGLTQYDLALISKEDYLIDNILKQHEITNSLALYYDYADGISYLASKLPPKKDKKAYETDLLRAVKEGNYSTVKYLITQGAETDVMDQDGNTLLTYAAIRGRMDIMGLLLSDKSKIISEGQEELEMQSLMQQEDEIEAIYERETFTPNELYLSYFSNSALIQIAEIVKTGKMTPSIKRYITVFFIDMVGFSTMAENIDSEKVIFVLNYFFNQLDQTIHRYKGDVDKFIGDAMLVTFDSAENAVRCAIEILNRDLDILNSKLEYMEIPEIKVHLGINTGWVIQGNVGSKRRRETTVIGDGVNIASRLQNLTPPNEIWITSRTMAAIGKIQKQFEQVGSIKLKGRDHEEMVYRHQKRIPEDHTVLCYETDGNLLKTLKSEMEDIGIKDVRTIDHLDKVKSLIDPKKIKVFVIGPSIDPSFIENTINVVKTRIKRSIPVIPLIRQKINARTLKLFEELGLNLYIPLYKKEGMARLMNALINEKVKDIPKIEKEPHPLYDDGFLIPPKEKVGAHTQETQAEKAKTESLIYSEMEGNVKLDIPSKDEIILDFTNIIPQTKIDTLRNRLEKYYHYVIQHGEVSFVFNLYQIKPDKIDDDFLKSLLKSLNFIENPKNVKIQFVFPPGNIQADYEHLKIQFRYQFVK